MSSAPAAAPSRPAPRLSRSAKIGLGLLLTLVGLFLLSILLPDSPVRMAELLPVAAVGMLALWIGGILMGNGGRS